MTRIAFFAPMKSPDHPTPSGDREMARGVMAALADPARGTTVDLVSDLRLYDGRGDGATQARLMTKAKAEADRLIARGGWSAWVTYHNYYKAPDLIGPVVSRALGIPYIQIEGTRAYKRHGGPWDRFARAAHTAADAAQVMFYLTDRDGVALAEHAPSGQAVLRLKPFLRRDTLPAPCVPEGPRLLCAGMMRRGDKLASYRIAAAVLHRITHPDWVCEIAGDGSARAEVEALFAPFGPRVRFLGLLDAEGMQAAYHRARVFLWPGVNEAFGMVYLEAQAAGVPVVAEDRAGVCDVLPAAARCPVEVPDTMAHEIDRLLGAADHWAVRSAEARDLVRDHHLLPAARARLWSALAPLMKDPT